MPIPDPATCHRALRTRDERFDGWFFVGVTSTGIYCRPSCPARTPAPERCRWFATAGSAQHAGFRACRRCRPDAVPGSPQWNPRSDVAARAIRLIEDGVVEREGVDGLAARLGFASRHVHRVLVAETGAGPLALARARRAHTARLLLQHTDLAVTDVAFASGWSSVRQFNAGVREVFAATPTELRRAARRGTGSTEGEAAGAVEVSLRARLPFAAGALAAFLGDHLVAGVETGREGWYSRAVRLPGGTALVSVLLDDAAATTGVVRTRLWLAEFADLAPAVARVRSWLDLDADPVGIDAALAESPVLAPLVARTPGLRVPGALDPDELALRTVLGQFVSVRGAAGSMARISADHGDPLPASLAAAGAALGVDRLFPSPATLAALDPADLPVNGARARTLVALARALVDGTVALHPGVDRAEAEATLLAVPGIGPWTAGYVAMRALGDPDRALVTDLVLGRRLAATGLDPASVRPWRSYATCHLWHDHTSRPAKESA